MRALIACSALLLAACAGAGESQKSCRDVGEQYPAEPVSIADALERKGRLQTVRGALIAEDGVPDRLCSGLSGASPPLCLEPSLAVDGVRDLSAFDNLQSAGDTAWIESAIVGGRVDGDTIRFAMTCRTSAVRRYFEAEAGVELTINFFQTTSVVERLDAAPLPELMPAKLKEEFGWFGLAVRAVPPRNGESPFFSHALGGARPGEHGVMWLRENGKWIAYKRYGADVVLLWTGGAARQLDERWHRLDRVLRELPSAVSA